MNETVNKFLSRQDRFLAEMHLKQPELNYSAYGPFTKNKERIQRLNETADSRYIYRNELDKACFQHDMAYGDFKDLARRTDSDVLKNKAFSIAKNPKNDRYQRGFDSMFYKIFYKNSKASGINNIIKQNTQLAKELHKPITKNIKRRKAYLWFKDNIFGANLADM